MNDIENLEKIIMETNRLILSDFERIGVIWNHPNSIIEPKMKVHSVEEIDNLESINKGFHEIKHHLTKIKVKDQKNYEKYSEYFQKIVKKVIISIFKEKQFWCSSGINNSGLRKFRNHEKRKEIYLKRKKKIMFFYQCFCR